MALLEAQVSLELNINPSKRRGIDAKVRTLSICGCFAVPFQRFRCSAAGGRVDTSFPNRCCGALPKRNPLTFCPAMTSCFRVHVRKHAASPLFTRNLRSSYRNRDNYGRIQVDTIEVFRRRYCSWPLAI